MVRKTAFPRPDFQREEWMNLNGPWEFSLDHPIYDREIEVPYPWGSPLSGISEMRDGIGFYHKAVHWDPRGERIWLCFGAADYRCSVRVNDIQIGAHRGGYAQFAFDVTDAWMRDGENVISVEVSAFGGTSRSDSGDVRSSGPNTNLLIFHAGEKGTQTYGKQSYGPCRGIWQSVWLEARPSAYLSSFFVRTSIDGRVTIDISASAPDGSVVRVDFGPGIEEEAIIYDGKTVVSLQISKPRLWSPEDPYLYEGTLSLISGDTVDKVFTYFGVREIGSGIFGHNHRRYITLNGKPIYLNGVLDQSFNPQGYFTLPSDTDCREEIERLKRIGLNMARIHIKAEEPLKLYWADRLGLLIMEDFPCFWGVPDTTAREYFEEEIEQQILRDRNHPSVFYWVIFNETWGLFTQKKSSDGSNTDVYLPETVEWVKHCWKRVKALDPTRLVEDNSPCLGDHVITDVNSWHFYVNGYQRVKEGVEKFCTGAFIGSQKNYREGYFMGDVPCMNSECGNYHGIRGSAGESDISWQYKYMMNEFRRNDILCGFVFTEFHDVVNEFNGYYKLDNGDKEFGYDEWGMRIKDLHSQDYVGADYAPMSTVHPSDVVKVPLFGSSFTDERHGRLLTVVWTLKLLDPLDGDHVVDRGEIRIVWEGYGSFPAGTISTAIPPHDGTAILSWVLMDGEDTIMRNYIHFDVDGGKRNDALVLEPRTFFSQDFLQEFSAQEGNKRNGLGAGTFWCDINTAEIPGFDKADELRIFFEASTRMPMTHDFPVGMVPPGLAEQCMPPGYRCDPGTNTNAFVQTDGIKHPGSVTISIDGIPVGNCYLPDSPADSRGILSHYYQASDDVLDEAGSYGYLCKVSIPSSILLRLKQKDRFTLSFTSQCEEGLSLFGRRSGRYGIGILLRSE